MASSSVQIIAEAGMNHDGSLGNALRLVDAAAACGVDGVKFQLHVAAAETLREAPNPPHFDGEPRYAYFTRTAFTAEQWERVRAQCAARGVEFLCSPFSLEAVDLLEQIGVARYKVPSGEVTNLPLLERLARTGKPVLLSSGMSNWLELDAAVAALRQGRGPLTVLQCSSEYPCPDERVGLNVMLQMRERYGTPVGYSDHTLGLAAAVAAAALGASVIEKHFTLSRQAYGSDAKHSAEPAELAALVQAVRSASVILAHPVEKDDLRPYERMRLVFHKSLVAARDIPAGARLSADMVCCKKPGTGLSAARYHDVLGRRALRAIRADSLLADADIDWTDGAPSGAARVRSSHA